MVRAPCCEKMGLKKGPWTAEEDQVLVSFIETNGHGNWRALPKKAGLLRCGKSCRLRWINYLRPDIKRGNFTAEEEETIIRFHHEMGNKWSVIAAQLPGRTDNEIKNVWHTHIKKRLPQQQTSDASAKVPKKAKLEAAAGLSKSAAVVTELQVLQQSTTISSSDHSSWSRTDMESTSSSSNYAADELFVDFSSAMKLPVLDESFWNEALAMDALEEEQSLLEYSASSDAAYATSASASFSSSRCSSLQESTFPSPSRWVALSSNEAPLNCDGDMEFWLRLLIEADSMPEL